MTAFSRVDLPHMFIWAPGHKGSKRSVELSKLLVLRRQMHF
uniref:Uncharacterized protein n=1 Tax=Anguilla anguilla TaxID=7936 RepID=A0A0E9RZT7_ANGAN